MSQTPATRRPAEIADLVGRVTKAVEAYDARVAVVWPNAAVVHAGRCGNELMELLAAARALSPAIAALDTLSREREDAHKALDEIGAPQADGAGADGVGTLTIAGRCWALSNRWASETSRERTIPHGTAGGYTNHGCGCRDCRAAFATAMRAARNSRTERGLCITCPRATDGGGVRCKACRDRLSEKRKGVRR